MIVYWGVGAAFSRSGCAKPSLDHSFSAAVYNVIIKSSFKVLGCVQNVLSVESWHGLWKLLSAIAQGLNVHRIFLVPRHHQVSVPSVYSWPLQKSNRLDCLQFKVPQDGNELGGRFELQYGYFAKPHCSLQLHNSLRSLSAPTLCGRLRLCPQL